MSEYMTKILSKYEKLRGKCKDDWGIPFWDAVVITAADQIQARAFEKQIAEKNLSKELPVFDGIHVMADPTNQRIGCGGSTLLVLRKLKKIYEDALYGMRILLIHAGGQSQRLPSHSCLGKLFALLPLGHPTYQVLDFKLAMYLPFLERMKPGIFVTASDDIITFDLDQNPNWTFEGEGFTALAHPSPIDVAITHGVYVMSKDSSQCIRVLQKPSLYLLIESGAIVADAKGRQWAYTDSAFFFDHAITKKFLQTASELYPTNEMDGAGEEFVQPLVNCEVDAYGDFLQPLGSRPSEDYLACEGDLGNARRILFDTLKGSKINVVVLEKSTFYHLGTMREYVQHLTACPEFSRSLGVCKRSFSYPNEDSATIKGISMHSYLDPKSTIGKNSVLEYCDFQVPVGFDEGILSNCQLSQSRDPNPVCIPSGTFFYTFGLYSQRLSDNVYATVAFHLDDDIKKSCDVSECGKLKYMNSKLEDICSEPESLFKAGTQACSLWNARLFATCPTRDKAFRATLGFVKDRKLIIDDAAPSERVSMEDALERKNVMEILDFHGKLKQKISTQFFYSNLPVTDF